MKKLLLITISTFLLAGSALQDGLERGSAPFQRDACKIAKQEARDNYDVKDIDVGCNCEKSDSREWMCFVKFKYLTEEDQSTEESE